MSTKKPPDKADSTKSKPIVDKGAAAGAANGADDAANRDSVRSTINLENNDKPTSPEPVIEPAAKTEEQTISSPPKPTSAATAKQPLPLLGLFNLLLILGLIAAAVYYRQMQQQNEIEKQALLSELQSQLSQKADLAQLQSILGPLESDIGDSLSRIDGLQQQQQSLQDSTAKLFELYGREESDWQLAEVAYLMRIAQHKLSLENDFEGAALTLQAASDKIAATADPGLLPVRVLIGEEIAALKTRARPDLVGMTLLLSQLSQQIRQLKPGYQPVSEISVAGAEPVSAQSGERSLLDSAKSFFAKLYTIKRNDMKPTATEALIINIDEIMESNLKLTRWTVLERDDFQYRQLMQENVGLFKQYYDLDNAANNDFYTQLLQLQKSPIKPQKPSINGSLQLLKSILSRRQNAPDANQTGKTGEAADNV